LNYGGTVIRLGGAQRAEAAL